MGASATVLHSAFRNRLLIKCAQWIDTTGAGAVPAVLNAVIRVKTQSPVNHGRDCRSFSACFTLRSLRKSGSQVAGIASSLYQQHRKVKGNMPLLQVVVVLIVVGILLWLVDRFIPMAGSIKSILNAVVVITVVLWLLNVFGLMQSLSSIHIGKP